MKFFSAQYIFTNTSGPVKRGVIAAEDDGTIIGVEQNNGTLLEKHSVEFHNGIIVPGFVNCHCHLELSYLKNIIPQGNGLPDFLALMLPIITCLMKELFYVRISVMMIRLFS